MGFSNGEERVFDVKPLLDKPVYRPLKDVELLEKVHIIYDYTIAWNEDIDMCPDSLYISSPYEQMSIEDYRFVFCKLYGKRMGDG